MDEDPVLVFIDDDEGYTRWLASNLGAYVLNIRLKGGPGAATLHRATCRLISQLSPATPTFMGEHAKAVAPEPSALVDWSSSVVQSRAVSCSLCSPISRAAGAHLPPAQTRQAGWRQRGRPVG